MRSCKFRIAVPVEQPDGSGFYVSPTALSDPNINDPTDQRRYLDPLKIPFAAFKDTPVVRRLGIELGTFGVAIRRSSGPAVPFIVGDAGPRIGEGSVALARLAAGLTLSVNLNRNNRFQGIVDTNDVLWVFFGGEKMSPPYTPERVSKEAREAFEAWGGQKRLSSCLSDHGVPRAN